MGSAEGATGRTFPQENKMGPKDLVLLVTLSVCCVMYSNGAIAYKAHKNEVQNERRKIVKLLLRNFPLQESSSYHNLVEDDDVGQPNFQKGDHLTQYAPAYPYDGESTSTKHDQPDIKYSKIPKQDISRFEYALSTILLPPPINSEPIDVESFKETTENDADEYYAPYMKLTQPIKEATEENVDEYYEPYMQDMYKTYDIENLKLTQTDSEEQNAGQYYLPYMHYAQPEITSTNNAEEYYLPYNRYDQQHQDDWLQYHHSLPVRVFATPTDELPNLTDGALYEGPETAGQEELPTLQIGSHFSGPEPDSAENEIFQLPMKLLKLQQ